MKFSKLLPTYLDYQRTYNKTSSVKSLEHSYRRLMCFFGDRDLTSLTREDVAEFISHRRKTVKDVSINKDLRALRALLRFGVEIDALEELPVTVKMLRVARKRALRVLDRNDIEKLLECAKGPWHGIILLAAQTGFRSGEILHLQWKDIYFEEGRIAITSKPEWSPKSHQERSVFVADSVIHYLRERRKVAAFHARTDWVFASRRGTALTRTNTAREVRKVFKRADLYEKGTPLLHWLRHTACTRMLEQGISIEVVREVMGHSSITTTELYAHATSRGMKEASRVLAL